MELDDEVICVWFTKDDFPIGISDNEDYLTIPKKEWDSVVSVFENTKWDDPTSSSWINIHKDIYKLVGEKLNAVT